MQKKNFFIKVTINFLQSVRAVLQKNTITFEKQNTIFTIGKFKYFTVGWILFQHKKKYIYKIGILQAEHIQKLYAKMDNKFQRIKSSELSFVFFSITN